MLELLRQMVLTDTVRIALGLPPLAGGVMDDTIDPEAEADDTENLRRSALDVIHSGEFLTL